MESHNYLWTDGVKLSWILRHPAGVWKLFVGVGGYSPHWNWAQEPSLMFVKSRAILVMLAYLPRSPVQIYTRKDHLTCLIVSQHKCLCLGMVCLCLEIRVDLCYLYIPPVPLHPDILSWIWEKGMELKPPTRHLLHRTPKSTNFD